MFKKVLLLLTVAVMMVGCGEKAPKTLDIKAFAEEAVTAIDFGDDMIVLSETIAGDFYDLDFDGLTSYIIYTSGTRATASEIAVFELASEEAVEAAKLSAQTRIDDQKESYEDYRPDEMVKLNSPLIKVEGNYLLVSVTSDNATIENLFDKSFK